MKRFHHGGWDKTAPVQLVFIVPASHFLDNLTHFVQIFVKNSNFLREEKILIEFYLFLCLIMISLLWLNNHRLIEIHRPMQNFVKAYYTKWWNISLIKEMNKPVRPRNRLIEYHFWIIKFHWSGCCLFLCGLVYLSVHFLTIWWVPWITSMVI